MQVRSNDITWREIDGEMVILDLASSTYLTTNLTGTFLLQQLVEDRSHDDLVDALVTTFDIDRTRADRDATAFVDLLRDRDLLATSPATNGDA